MENKLENSNLYLIKLGEISLKGLNRSFFEKKLKNNIKLKIHPYHSLLLREKGRFYLSVDKNCPEETVKKALSSTFGIAGFSKAVTCSKEWETIRKTAVDLISAAPFSDGTGTFKVEARRADKQFPMNSYKIEAELGGVVLERYPDMKVDVHNPQKILYVEIRNEVYMYTSPIDGCGGIPVGVSGRGLLLLSGGIDSPVAGWRMAKRGLKLDCLYFHAYPYTSDQALQKVKDLAKLLGPSLQGTTLDVVNFTDAELWIKDHSKEDEHTLMMRAAMIKVADIIAKKRKCKVLVTGEALGQVASQTLEAMCFTSSMTDIPVLRPLVGMDKQEIIETARKIGTYDTSILPYDDCCVVFSPKHPLVRPDSETEKSSFSKMNIDDILIKCADEATEYEISYRV